MPTQTHYLPGLALTDHEFQVPLNHAEPNGQQITVYAREVVAVAKQGADLPWLIFFQGGPGGKALRPDSRSGWLKRATEEFRVLLLDQRGTGRSSTVNRQTLARLGSAQAQAEYLMHFRADSIVRDAELIRKRLLGPDRQWSGLGQSYGGFCLLTYLSIAPEGLREAFITGGLAPLDRHADDVYRLTYKRLRERNGLYFDRYPGDRARAQAVAAHLATHDVRLPNGERLSPRRFQTIGSALGMSNGFEPLHYLLEEAFLTGTAGPTLSDTFLYDIMNILSLATHPLYAILHEACYGQAAATRWSAHRIRAEYPEFDLAPDKPFLFTGEMIYPWQFEEDQALQPLAEAAEILAHYEDWPRLYDIDRLRANTVPCAAAVYVDDMYVERAFSEETARTLRGCRMWLTNEHQHNGIRADGEAILSRLIDMVRGER